MNIFTSSTIKARTSNDHAYSAHECDNFTSNPIEFEGHLSPMSGVFANWLDPNSYIRSAFSCICGVAC